MASFTTHLSLGQTAYGVAHRTECDFHVVTLTVGQIRVKETNPALRGAWETDPIMCVETGIGSGTLWQYGKNIFAAEVDACAAVVVHEQRAHKQRMERDARVAEERARTEASERREFDRLARKFAAGAQA